MRLRNTPKPADITGTPEPAPRKAGDVEKLVKMTVLMLKRAGATVTVDADGPRCYKLEIRWQKGQ